MERYVPARRRLARTPLTEARDFGLKSYGDYLQVLQKHRRVIVRMDQEPLDLLNQRIYAQEYGREFVVDRERRRYFFSLEGLSRCAFEVHLGDKYYEYCDRYRKGEEGEQAI